ncbi:MAG: hypothetical protein GEV03_24415 [Streptosporangiales bacterium]|nr:hypothetical protein [Streptosporangiales bacterium]
MDPLFRARFEISVTPGDVGRRVSLRRRLPDGRFTDAVGVLESWEHGRLTVRRRDGSLVELAEETLVAGKVVPNPPPPRRRSRSP